jgi:hypothetical protein
MNKYILCQRVFSATQRNIITVELNGDGLSVSETKLHPNCTSAWITQVESGVSIDDIAQRAIIKAIENGGHLDI